MRRALAALLLLAATFTTTLAAADCRLSRAAELPVTLVHGRMIVSGLVDGTPARFLFDTGSATTAITEAAAGRLGLKAIAPDHGAAMRGTFYGIGGSRRARPMEASSIDLGGLRARDFGFLVIDMAFGGDDPPDGLLSSDLLAKYDIDLDLPGGVIRLFYPQGDCARPHAFLDGTLYSAPLLPGNTDRSPRIRITVGGHPLTAMIDTGAHTVLFRGAAAALGIDTAALFAASTRRSGGIGPDRVRSAPTMLHDVAIGDLGLDRLPATLLDNARLDADMLLGLDFFSAVHAWISYSSDTLVMQVPARPSPPLPASAK